MTGPATRVSVVIPTYNAGPRVGPAIESVLAQTRPADEVVVVNDGGHAPTTEFVRAEFPTVRLIDAPHGGAAAARNLGARETTGEVLVFFDDDDVMEPHAVGTLLGLLADFPAARAAFTDHALENRLTGERVPDHHTANPAFARLSEVPVLARRGDARLYGRAMFTALLRGNLLQQPWAVYRETFYAIGGFTAGLASSNDWDIYLRLTRAVPVGLSDRVCSTHLIEPGKPHLTLLPDQEERHLWVMGMARRLLGWHELRSRAVLRRRAGVCYKALGDRAAAVDLRAGWRRYRQSFTTWPFDPVVAARALVLWPARLAVGGRPIPPDHSPR